MHPAIKVVTEKDEDGFTETRINTKCSIEFDLSILGSKEALKWVFGKKNKKKPEDLTEAEIKTLIRFHFFDSGSDEVDSLKDEQITLLQ